MMHTKWPGGQGKLQVSMELMTSEEAAKFPADQVVVIRI